MFEVSSRIPSPPMKTRTCLLSALLIFAAGAPCATAAVDTNSDETAIRQLITDFATAWNRHDAKAMAESYADDADMLNPFGRAAKGRAEIEQLFTDEHAHAMKASTFSVGHIDVHRLSSDVAVAEAPTDVSGMLSPEGKALPPLKIHLVIICTKKDGKWHPTIARPYAFLQRPAGPPAKAS